MKKWSLLSIPLVGLASITVWSQAVAGAPADQFSGVVVREPVRRDSVLIQRPGQPPLPRPNATSPALKSAPLSPATSPASKAAEAPDTGAATPEDGAIVERVAPAQVTSPAVAPTDDSTSHSNLDDSTSGSTPGGSGGLSGNKGTGGGSHD